MPISVLVPVAVFLAMGVVVVLSLWRIVVVGGEARRGTQSLRLASDVAHRADGCLADLVATVDALRHRRIRPDEAAEALASGSAALWTLATEARGATAQAGTPAVAELVSELERAIRSLELIDHGRELMEIEGGTAGEGETSIKRGYLNLIHSRDAIRLTGTEIRARSAAGSSSGVLGHR